MAKLKAKQRKALPTGDFAGPNRSFPINDAPHARQALRERKFAPDPDAIVQKVKSRFPGIQPRAGGGPVSPGRNYLVGENGPEVLQPKMPGMVQPNLTPRVPMPSVKVQPRIRPKAPALGGGSIRQTSAFKGLMGALKRRG